MNWQDFSTWLPLLLVVAVVAGLVLYAANRREHRALIDSMSDGMLVLDRRNRVLNANLTAQQIIGRPAADLMGRPLVEFLPGVDILPDDNRVETRTELTLGQGDNRRYYDYRLSPLHGRTGHFTGWLLVLRDITDRKEIEDSLLTQKQLFESLVSVARATAEMPTLAATLQNALDVAAKLTRAEFGSLILVDKSGAVTHSIMALGRVVPAERHNLARRVLDKGLAGWVVKHQQLALIDDTAADDRWLPSAGGDYTARSALAVPIVSRATLLGILTLTHSDPHCFTSEHAHLMQAAADQMVLAVRNAQMYDEQHRLADRQVTVYEVLRTVGSHLDTDVVVREAVEVVARLTRWPFVAILAPDESEANLEILASAGAAVYENEKNDAAIPIAAGISGRAYRSGETQHVPDVTDDPDYVVRHPYIRSEMAVPLLRGERVLGVLNVESDQPMAFDSDDLQLAASIAEAIALALDNARFHTEMRQYATDLTTLYTVTRTIGHSLILEDVLAKTLSTILSSLDFDAGVIAVADPGNGRLSLAAHQGLPVKVTETISEQEQLIRAFCAHAHESHEEVIIDDIDQARFELIGLAAGGPEMVTQIRALDMRACATVPLIHQDHSLGALCLFARQPHPFSANDVVLQVTVGQQIATAVTNVRLFRAAADERTLFQALIESSRDGIILIGMNQNTLVVNAPALDLLHLHGRPRDWINRPFAALLDELKQHAPAAAETTVAEMSRFQEGDESPGEGEYDIPPGTIRWLNLPVRADEAALGRLLVFRDVTEERLLERMRDDLTHTTVHDLRNPLGGIFSALELLDRDAVHHMSPEQRQVLQIARNSAQRMLRLVNAILDISRLESGRMPLERSSFVLPQLIEDLLQTQLPLAQEKDICLESDLPPALPPTWADMNLIERVLQNLVGNAIKFAPDGGIVRVSVKAPTVGQPWLLIAVSDNGKGIPPEIQSRLFQKFATGGQDERGSGLGLAFCRMVMKEHGELIWVENAPTGGATFYFTLPVAPAL